MRAASSETVVPLKIRLQPSHNVQQVRSTLQPAQLVQPLPSLQPAQPIAPQTRFFAQGVVRARIVIPPTASKPDASKNSPSVADKLFEQSPDHEFCCKICGRGFDACADLVTHMAQAHPMAVPKKVSTAASKLAGTGFRCSTCLINFNTATSYVTHMHRHHSGDNPIGDVRFSRYNNVSQYKCTFCSAKFKLYDTYHNHMTTAHTQINYKCTQCDAAYSSYGLLQQHLGNTHPGKECVPFWCKICGQGFQRKSPYFRHMREKHPDAPLSAPSPPAPPIVKVEPDAVEASTTATVSKEVVRVEAVKKLVEGADTTSSSSPPGVPSTEYVRCAICYKVYVGKRDYLIHVLDQHPGSYERELHFLNVGEGGAKEVRESTPPVAAAPKSPPPPASFLVLQMEEDADEFTPPALPPILPRFPKATNMPTVPRGGTTTVERGGTTTVQGGGTTVAKRGGLAGKRGTVPPVLPRASPDDTAEEDEEEDFDTLLSDEGLNEDDEESEDTDASEVVEEDSSPEDDPEEGGRNSSPVAANFTIVDGKAVCTQCKACFASIREFLKHSATHHLHSGSRVALERDLSTEETGLLAPAAKRTKSNTGLLLEASAEKPTSSSEMPVLKSSTPIPALKPISDSVASVSAPTMVNGRFRRAKRKPLDPLLPHALVACYLCGLNFISDAAVRVHMEKQHPPMSLPVAQRKLTEHTDNLSPAARRRRKREAVPPCEVCGLRFVSRVSAALHFVKNHLSEGGKKSESDAMEGAGVDFLTVWCSVCGRGFDSALALRTHLRRSRCSDISQNNPVLTSEDADGDREDVEREGGPAPNAPFPRLMFLDRDSFRPFKCSRCPKAFKRLEGLNLHRFRHSIRSHVETCLNCSAEFFNKIALERHLRVCTGEAPTSPGEEGVEKTAAGEKLTLQGPKLLDEEGGISSNVAPFRTPGLSRNDRWKCSICSATFNHYMPFENHMSQGHGLKTLGGPSTEATVCGHCFRYFRRKTAYYRHLREKHNGVAKTFELPEGADGFHVTVADPSIPTFVAVPDMKPLSATMNVKIEVGDSEIEDRDCSSEDVKKDFPPVSNFKRSLEDEEEIEKEDVKPNVLHLSVEALEKERSKVASDVRHRDELVLGI